MSTHVGVGTSSERSESQAGRQATQEALEALEGNEPDLLLVFATAGYDPEDLIGSIREAGHHAPLSGCTGEGIITRRGSEEGSHAVTVMAVASEELTFATLGARELERASDKAGRSLADQALEKAPEGGEILLLFPDGLTVNTTRLFEGLEAGLAAWTDGLPTIVGGTAGELMQIDQTFQFHDDEVLTDGVAGVLVGGDIQAEVEVSHGCLPIGLEREITKARENWVEEIDERPAFEVFKEYFDDDPEELRPEDIVHMCFGELIGDPEEHGPDAYLIRTPLALDPETGALRFPAELAEGTRIQLTRRDPEEISRRAREMARSMADRHPGEDPLLALQFDCAGRGRILFGEKVNQHAIEPVQEAFGPDVPWIGFHTYGEIAPKRGRTRFHNYTVVLSALYQG